MKKYIFDSCVLYASAEGFSTDELDTLFSKFTQETKLGVNDDGVSFTLEQELHQITEAGDNDRAVVGRERIISCKGTIEGTINVFDDTLFKMCSLKKDTSNKSTKYDLWIPKTGVISEDAYVDIALVGRTTTGNDLCIIVHNCYNEEGLSIDSKSKDEAGCKVKFVGRIKEADKDIDAKAVPVEIITLKATV